MKKVVVIGSGFSGLAAAAVAAKHNMEVLLVEKNASIGGRARTFSAEGFTFDMGPSWYWMPEIFEKFYNTFGHTASDFYSLQRLDPSYQMVFKDDVLKVPANFEHLGNLLENYEKGASTQLKKFLDEASYKYQAGMGKFVYLPGKSLLEFLDFQIIEAATKMDLFTDMSTYVKKFFKDPRIISLLEFPVLFLGAMPSQTPALYSLMNYADLVLGTWYPMGGMYKIIEAFEKIARKQGVKIFTNSEVRHIEVQNGKATGVWVNGQFISADYVIASSDYHHTDTQLLAPDYRQYSDKYWNTRKMAPSSLLYYLGINKKLPRLLHHTLFFDADFKQHAKEIYENPVWPTDPLIYVSATSVTDPAVAPENCENIFILIPTAPGLLDDPSVKDKYFHKVIHRLEKFTQTNISQHIVYRKDYAASNFIADYHAFKGNAYGLANTLMQTGPLKPALVHKKINNLIFTGQLTVPGPGVPPSIISGQLAVKELLKLHYQNIV